MVFLESESEKKFLPCAIPIIMIRTEYSVVVVVITHVWYISTGILIVTVTVTVTTTTTTKPIWIFDWESILLLLPFGNFFKKNQTKQILIDSIYGIGISKMEFFLSFFSKFLIFKIANVRIGFDRPDRFSFLIFFFCRCQRRMTGRYLFEKETHKIPAVRIDRIISYIYCNVCVCVCVDSTLNIFVFSFFPG